MVPNVAVADLPGGYPDLKAFSRLLIGSLPEPIYHFSWIKTEVLSGFYMWNPVFSIPGSIVNPGFGDIQEGSQLVNVQEATCRILINLT